MDRKLFILPIDEEQADVLIKFIEQQTEKNSVKQIEATEINSQKRYLTLDELAELLSIPRNTIYAKTSRREIPFLKVGRRLMFDRHEIEKWLSESQKKVLK